MKLLAFCICAMTAVPAGAAPYVAPPTTKSFVRSYWRSQNVDVVDSGPRATAAASDYSTATADYGRLAGETVGIPLDGGTGRNGDAGAFAESSASDTLFLDFGVANRVFGPLSLSFDFSVAGAGLQFGPPAFPASVGWMAATALWGLNVPRGTMSGYESIERYFAYFQSHQSYVRNGNRRTFIPITGNFNLTVPYDPRGHRVSLVPFDYSMYCGAGNQEIVIAGSQASCLGWSFQMTGVHLLDATGALVPDVEISAASTFDYNGSGVPILPPSLVPEPLTWWMLVTGFILTGALVRSRRRPAASPT